MSTTLVVSDLHLGARLRRDVLRLPKPLEALVEAVRAADRLVLLGDVVEMLEGDVTGAMEDARPVLAALGAVAGEVLVVPGNHDHALVRPWLSGMDVEQRRRLKLAAPVAVGSGPLLEQLAAMLKPASVRVRYPGAWLDPRRGIYAHHGHYLDRHLFTPPPQARRLLPPVPEQDARAWDYERAVGPSYAALTGMLATISPPWLSQPIDAAAGALRRASLAAVPFAEQLVGDQLAPFNAGLLGMQFKRTGLRAMNEVVMRLGVKATHVLFGHVHRAGPLADDDLDGWVTDSGAHLHNTGSWVYEPLLLAGAGPGHPYWPGGAIRVTSDGDRPELVSLLDGLEERDLRP